MIIGVPKEIKDYEYRVSLTPDGARVLLQAGHRVVVEPSAGQGSGFSDDAYRQAGVQVAGSKAEVFQQADLIVKVKEPQLSECVLFRPGQVLFTYLHLASLPDLTKALVAADITAIAYETVEARDHSLPMLRPMSEIAGRLAVQIGAHYLGTVQGGRGLLLAGVPGVPPAHVVVLGAGVVGTSAVRIAVGMGARVTVINLDLDRLRFLDDLYGGRIATCAATESAIERAVVDADLVIGAVLVPGARAPKVVSRALVKKMKPGSVIVDVAVDQGGCCETTRPTTHSDPVYVVDGVLHYCVTNMPGIVPHTSTLALTNTTLPYIVRLASEGVEKAIRSDPGLAKGGERDERQNYLPRCGRCIRLAFYPRDVRQSGFPFSVLPGRGVAQPGSALRSGRRGRRFKSSRPDQTALRATPHLEYVRDICPPGTIQTQPA
jgi:alanine dehydrogenase